MVPDYWDLEKTLDQSLLNLRTDYVDLCIIKHPVTKDI